MATQQKKANTQSKTSPASAARATAASADKVASQAFSAMESTRSSAENFVRIGAATAKEFLASSTGEASKAQDKVYAMGRESAENVSRAVDAMAQTLNDSVEMFRENADACIEVCHIASDVAKTVQAEAINFANGCFIDNIELCKETFACRNANDLIEVQNRWFSTNMDNFFSQSSKIAEMCFQMVSEVSEPINERIAEVTERFSKTMAA